MNTVLIFHSDCLSIVSLKELLTADIVMQYSQHDQFLASFGQFFPSRISTQLTAKALDTDHYSRIMLNLCNCLLLLYIICLYNLCTCVLL